MLTRLRRPSLLKQLSLTAVLAGLLAYLGYSAISGQYGLNGRELLSAELVTLNAQSARLQAEVEAYGVRVALFDPEKLDPDILTERAVDLLGMAHENDRVIIPGSLSNKL